MPDPRFFAAAGPFTLGAIAEMAGATIGGDADRERRFVDVASLDAAGPDDVTFLDDPRYAGQLAGSKGGAGLLRADTIDRAPPGMALLICAEPYRSFAKLAAAFYPRRARGGLVHPTAIVDPTARVADDCDIGAGAIIGAGADLGSGCEIGVNAVIGPGVVLGRACQIGPAASLLCCLVGNRVVIHAGSRIGQDGFGFVPGRDGHDKVPQLGRVIIGDDVEIGANTTIDRGTLADTVIGAGTKIDNLVQIGHNVTIGRGCIIVSQAGISGSTIVGDGVMIAGQAGLIGHLKIGEGARIGAQAGIMRDVPAGETVLGAPAVPKSQFMRQVAVLAKLASGKGRG